MHIMTLRPRHMYSPGPFGDFCDNYDSRSATSPLYKYTKKLSTSFFNNGLSFDLGQNDFQMNESSYKNEPHFTNPESSFAFRSKDEYADEKNDSEDGIRTFLNHLRHVLMIDAAHLKGLYKGTNLVAVAMDGNNQIMPIAFGICKGETGPCWSWWMSVLKECIGDNPNLIFISDRHAAISLAVENEFPLAFHVVCCRHLMMNLSLKTKKRKGLFWKICKAYTREDFATSMNILQIVQPDA
ncbi:transposase, MuDR, MULE transposase domain protein [Tanacetum coccineum]